MGWVQLWPRCNTFAPKRSREVDRAPEGIHRKYGPEHENDDDVKHYPSDHVPLASNDEHESLETSRWLDDLDDLEIRYDTTRTLVQPEYAFPALCCRAPSPNGTKLSGSG